MRYPYKIILLICSYVSISSHGGLYPFLEVGDNMVSKNGDEKQKRMTKEIANPLKLTNLIIQKGEAGLRDYQILKKCISYRRCAVFNRKTMPSEVQNFTDTTIRIITMRLEAT